MQTPTWDTTCALTVCARLLSRLLLQATDVHITLTGSSKLWVWKCGLLCYPAINWPLTHPTFNLKISRIVSSNSATLGRSRAAQQGIHPFIQPWMGEWRATFGTFLNKSATHPTKGTKWLAKMTARQIPASKPPPPAGRSHASHVLRALCDDMQRGSSSVNNPDSIRGGCEHFTGISVSHNYESAVRCSDSCEQRVTRGG